MRTLLILAAALCGLVTLSASAQTSDPPLCETWLDRWQLYSGEADSNSLRSYLNAVPRRCANLRRQIERHIEHRYPTTTTPFQIPGRPPQPVTPVALPTFRDCADCPEMVTLPGGSFIMGSPPDEVGRQANENRRPATVAPFAAAKYETTWAEWQRCVDAGVCRLSWTPNPAFDYGSGNRPVYDLTWTEMQTYLAWLSNRAGRRYRLLTEQEWEFAARGPIARESTPTRFSWGNQDPVCEGSAFNGASFLACPGERSSPVGSFPPNAWGLYDMHGNAGEWTQSCYDTACTRRVIRGGSFVDRVRDLRSASRGGALTTSNGGIGYVRGFRVARGV